MANTDVNKYPYTGQAEQNPYGGVSLENLVAVISALLPKGGNNSSPEGSSLVSQISTDTSPVSIPVPEIANNVVDPSQLMRIEKGSYGPASTETSVRQSDGKVQKQPDQYSGNKPLRKDQEILDKYSSGDITASVVNGQLHLTNQGPGSLQRQTDQAKAGQLNAEVISFQEKMKAIQAEPDLSVREAMLNTFQADVGEIQTKELNKFRAIAEGQLGIPTLRQQLAYSEMTDKQDPYYHMFLSDSPQTMKIRQALAIAEQRAMGQTQELATRDPMFIRRGLEVKGFIDRQTKFITDR